MICCRDGSSPGLMLATCSSWSSAPATPAAASAVSPSALRQFAAPCTSAGILNPFDLSKQVPITTLTSARQELQVPRATCYSTILHWVTSLLFVTDQSALNTRQRCYQHYFCVHILFQSFFLLGPALLVTSPWPYHLLCESASGYCASKLRCFPVIALPWSAVCLPSRQTSGKGLKL